MLLLVIIGIHWLYSCYAYSIRIRKGV